MMPPFAYHSAPNVGMDGGLRLKEPETVKCGSVNFGNSRCSPLKKLAIAFSPSKRRSA